MNKIILIFVILLIILFLYMRKDITEGFQSEECVEFDSNGQCLDNLEEQYEEQVENNSEEQVENNSEDKSKECEHYDDNGKCINNLNEYLEKIYFETLGDTNDSNNSNNSALLQEQNNIVKREIDLIEKAKLNGKFINKTDPENIGLTVNGVIEKITGDKLKNYIKLYREPDELNTVQYETDKCIMERENKIGDYQENSVGCYNEDFINNHTTGKCLPRPNLLQCHSDYNDVVDPIDFYKKFRAQVAYMEDPNLKGYNYDTYAKFHIPQQIDKKLFDKNEYIIPSGRNYV
jgi:hypothetical protein